MTKRVLLVGGSSHGKWMEIDRKSWYVRVPKPLTIPTVVNEADLRIEPLLDDLAETYRIERVPVQFEGMRCVVETGIWSGLYGIDKTKAVISALFQRDIAELFREDTWAAWD